MARARTLTQLQGDLQYLADAQGLSLRHDTTNQTRLINQSIQRFRAKLSAEGSTHYLVSVATPTMTIGATSPYHFGVIDFTAASPAVVQVYGIDVKVNSTWYALDAVEFSARHEYQSSFGGDARRPPVAFANFQTAKVAIFPPSDAAYQYNAWYLPLLPDLVNGADGFDGVAGWEEWVIWDAFVPMINRDQYPQMYALATAERAERWQDIIRVACHVNRTAVTQRRDTWGESRWKADRSRERWP